MPIAAVIQLTSEPEVEKNLSMARRLLEQARTQGAVLAALPENFAFMGREETDKVAIAEPFGEGPIQSFLARTAQELRMWIVGGTVPIRVDQQGKVASASIVFDDQGRCAGRYDKMHLFDVDIPERNERYRESATVAAGATPTVISTSIGRLGMAVCYDIRFPELFRTLQALGAEVLSVPSAFTALTGKAHWEVLLRARAIENLSYVLAPAQGGIHENGRETYGDSMIVDPWGQVLARVSAAGPGVALANIDHTSQQELRVRFPALTHRRLNVS
jgi:nitrilase